MCGTISQKIKNKNKVAPSKKEKSRSILSHKTLDTKYNPINKNRLAFKYASNPEG